MQSIKATDWRRYFALLSSYLCCNLGDGVVLVFMTMVTSKISESPQELSWVISCLSLPWLFLSIFTGVWIDQFGPIQVAKTASLFRTVFLLVLSLLLHLLAPPIYFLCLTAFCIGTCEVLVDNSTPLLVPQVVRTSDLEKANGYISSVEIIGHKFLGANLGVLLTKAHSSMSAFLGGSLYGLSLLLIHSSFRNDKNSKIEAFPNPYQPREFLKELATGFMFFKQHSGLFTFAMIGFFWNFCTGAEQSFLIFYVRKTLNMEDWFYGALLSAGGLGAVVGSLFIEKIVIMLGHFRILMMTLFIFSMQFLIRGIWINPWVSLICLFFNGFGLVLLNAVNMSYRQRNSPQHMFGKINAIIRLMSLGALPVGALVCGFLSGPFNTEVQFFEAF